MVRKPLQIMQRHREAAATSLLQKAPNDRKIAAVAQRIRAGQADDHPAVQAAAFYE